MPSMEPKPARPRDVLWTMSACLLVALLALAVCRFGPKPWEGRTGKIVFGKDVARLTTGEKWGGTVSVYLRKSGEAAEKMGTEEWVAVGLWVGSLATAAIFLVLGISAPLWVRWSRAAAGGPGLLSGWSAPRWSWIVLACALAVAGLLRWPWCLR